MLVVKCYCSDDARNDYDGRNDDCEAPMKPFTVHRGRVAPLDRVNVDTDQIIPKQFLKRIERTGFGQFVFYDWRFGADSTKNGFLAVQLSDHQVAELMKRAQEIDDYEVTIDLEKCEVRDEQGFRASFPIDEFIRHCLLN